MYIKDLKLEKINIEEVINTIEVMGFDILSYNNSCLTVSHSTTNEPCYLLQDYYLFLNFLKYCMINIIKHDNNFNDFKKCLLISFEEIENVVGVDVPMDLVKEVCRALKLLITVKGEIIFVYVYRPLFKFINDKFKFIQELLRSPKIKDIIISNNKLFLNCIPYLNINKNNDFQLIINVKNLLLNNNFNEIKTPYLIRRKPMFENCVVLYNSIKQYKFLRPSIIYAIIYEQSSEIYNGNKLEYFEIGHVFNNNFEYLALCIISFNSYTRCLDVLERINIILNIPNYCMKISHKICKDDVTELKYFYKIDYFFIDSGNFVPIGYMGYAKPKLLREKKLRTMLYYLELNFDKLINIGLFFARYNNMYALGKSFFTKEEIYCKLINNKDFFSEINLINDIFFQNKHKKNIISIKIIDRFKFSRKIQIKYGEKND